MKLNFSNISSYTNIFRPSAAGVVIYSILSIVLLLLQQIPNFQPYLELPSNWHVGSIILVVLNDFLLKLFGTSKLDTIVLSIFWMVVGLVVYLFLKSAIAFCVEMAQDIDETKNFVHPQQPNEASEFKQLITRGFFRLFVLIIAVFYFIWMVEFFAHGKAANVPIFGQWFESFPLFRDISIFIVQCFALYVFTILLRLVLIRKRLFG
jgi:hypothetical protein